MNTKMNHGIGWKMTGPDWGGELLVYISTKTPTTSYIWKITFAITTSNLSYINKFVLPK